MTTQETIGEIPASVHHLFLSPGHNYFGHHGRPAGENPLVAVDSVECVAGQGLRGDRFFGFKEDYKGQITFFSMEVLEELWAQFGIPPEARDPGVTRRNVIVSGVDLNSLIGRRFTLQSVLFEGAEECRPCYWMDGAIAPGAETAMRGRGGLRARILSDGWLKTNRKETGC